MLLLLLSAEAGLSEGSGADIILTLYYCSFHSCFIAYTDPKAGSGQYQLDLRITAFSRFGMKDRRNFLPREAVGSVTETCLLRR
jgi:hypothetical protein